MDPNCKFLNIAPVLPSLDIERDVTWYTKMTGFEPVFYDNMYAVLQRGDLVIHLQWHADTSENPLTGGSVIRIEVQNVESLFEEFLARGIVKSNGFKKNTPWRTNEFGFFDLNNNTLYMAEPVL